MERSLYLSALAMGLVAWICSLLLLPRRVKKSGYGMGDWLPLPYRLAAGIVPLAGFVASLQTRPPFASGQGLGIGLLLGSIGAYVTLLTLERGLNMDAQEETGESRSSIVCAAPFALAVVTTAIPLLWMRNVVVDALLGVALGWLTSTLLLLAGLNAARSAGRMLGLTLTAGTGFTATLCAIGAIGELGGNVRVGSGFVGVPWSAPLMLLAAFMVFVALLCALPASLLRQLPGANLLLRGSSSLKSESARQIAPNIARWLVGSLLFVGMGTQFGHRLWGQPNVFRLIGMGVLASGLAWWMLAGQLRTASNRYGNGSGNWPRMALPALVMMAAGMVAFQMLSGVGFAIMLLGAWLTMGIALAGSQQSEPQLAAEGNARVSALSISSELLRVLLFGTVLLLYRLYQVRYRNDLQNVLLPDHYALLGFIVGAAVPAALANYQGSGVRGQGSGREQEEKEKRRKGEEKTEEEDSSFILHPLSLPNTLLPMLIAGVLLLFVPTVLLMLFGTKCLLCLFFGLALAAVIGEGSHNNRLDADLDGARAVPGEWLTGLFALGIGLAVAQWTAHILPVTLMARTDKTRLLTYLTGIVAVLLFVTALIGRMRPSTASTQKGGAR